MEYSINKTKRLKDNQYYPRHYKKTSMFLHHTAGTNASGAIAWWNQTPSHVGTAYVIDRDGTIYECFDPECYAYHLGIKGDDNYLEKHSINIEIVSAGQLRKDDNGEFRFYPLWPNKAGSRVIPEKDVWTLEKKWRGHHFYHNYTKKQIGATLWLIEHLHCQFSIPIQKSFNKWFEFNDKVYKEPREGIFSHSTVRKDKNDIIPHPDFLKPFYALMKELGMWPGKMPSPDPYKAFKSLPSQFTI